jgi:FkbM family methyltransferase
MERMHYHCGVRGDYWNAALIQAFLGAGDTYVDVGANLGVHSLRASRAVGGSGRVYAFEPNPRTRLRLRLHAAMNDARNIVIVELALSDHEGEGSLRSGDCYNSGMFTLERHGLPENSVAVRICRGDSVLHSLSMSGRVLVKIDVEGHELSVLRGMRRWLAAVRPMLTVEITPAWLKEAGADACEVWRFFQELGYVGYMPLLSRRWNGDCLFRFQPLHFGEFAALNGQHDIFWTQKSERLPDELRFSLSKS